MLKIIKFGPLLWSGGDGIPRKKEGEVVKLFIHFLHEHKLYSKYMYYSIRFINGSGMVRQKSNPISFISEAFSWLQTVEGYSYWHDIDNKWNLILNDWKINNH